MSESTRNPHQSINTPTLETLEDRLMLTTLYSGEHFIYLNSQGDAVRVSLDVGPNAGTGAVIELFAHRLTDQADPTSAVIVHLPGIRYDVDNNVGLVDWWDGEAVVEEEQQAGSGGASDPNAPSPNWAWVEYTEADDNSPARRGARVDIFMIYVAKATPNMTLTLSTLAEASIPALEDGGLKSAIWKNNITMWESQNTPILDIEPPLPGGGDPDVINSPDDSGGVLVGGYHVPYTGLPEDADADDMSKYVAVGSDAPFWVEVQQVDSPNGPYGLPPENVTSYDPSNPVYARSSYFTDELMHPGITVAPGSFQLSTSLTIGSNVHAVATDASGMVYAVDSSAFIALVVNDNASGAMGNDVSSLTSVQNNDGSVTFYAVDNAGDGVVGDPDNLKIGSDVKSMAAAGADAGAYTGAFFMVNEASHRLMKWTEATGLIDIGQVTDADQISFRFDNIRSLDYNEVNNKLYAIATLTNTSPGSVTTPDDIGPFLIAISPLNGLVTNRVQLYTDAGRTIKYTGSITAMTITESGKYYAVNGVNELVEIDPTTGVISPGFNLVDDVTGSPVDITGLDAVGDTLYAVSVNALYLVDEATGDCTKLKDTGFTGMQSLAYDSSRPGSMYTVTDIGGSSYVMGRIPLGATFVTSDSSGVVQAGSVLVDSADETVIWNNVHALEYDTVFEKIYAVGMRLGLSPYDASDASYWIIEIDPATGVVTSGARLDDPATKPTDLASIAFDSTGQAWGVEPGGELYKFDPGNGTGTVEATLFFTNNAAAGQEQEIVGLAFVQVDGVDVLYGVTNEDIYVIDTATGECHDMTANAPIPFATNNVTTGSTSLGSLTNDPSDPLVLWATSNGSDGLAHLTRIDLSATMVVINPTTGTVDRIGGLLDYDEEFYGFQNITSLEYDINNDVFYAVGDKMNLDPVNEADPAAGLYLVELEFDIDEVGAWDVDWGVTLTEDDIVSIAYDDLGDVWYAATVDSLYDLDITTSGLTNGGLFFNPTGAPSNVTGLDFEDGVLYLSDSGTPGLYEVVPATGFVTRIATSTFPLFSLSGDPVRDEQLWSTTTIGNQAYLIDVSANPLEAQQEIDQIVIAGTLAGRFTMVGNIEVLRMGFFWGQAKIDGNNTVFSTQAGGGAVPGFTSNSYIGVNSTETQWVDLGNGYLEPATTYKGQSLINISGISSGIYSRSGTLHSAIQVGSNRFAKMPSGVFTEYEDRQEVDSSGAQEDFAYRIAWLEGRPVDRINDTPETAQFFNHPTGAYTFSGTITTSEKDPSANDWEDWFAVPLLAGETITLGGNFGFIGELAAEFYDPMMNYVDSFGFETIEDIGFSSRGSTPKPMQFTAKMAGVYYIRIWDYVAFVEGDDPDGTYTLSVSGVSGSVLGGVSIIGNYDGRLYSGNDDAAGYDITTEVGGTLGAVVITDDAIETYVYAIGGGDLIAFEAGQIGTEIQNSYTTALIRSDANIGRVASTVGYFSADIVAGGHGYSSDAYIQNIYAATDLIFDTLSTSSVEATPGIDATGSIGVIEVGGIFGGVTITVNEDLDPESPGGFIGLIDVGDWGGEDEGVPSITHGPGGDVGYVHVSGAVYQITGIWVSLIDPVSVTDGSAKTLTDDGGGNVRITPTVDPATGLATTYSYVLIPLRTDAGGIIANITADGPLSLNADGLIQIGELHVTAGAVSNITMSGSGKLEVYYLNTSDVVSIINNTEGDLVSGSVGTVDSMRWGGSIGPVYHEPTLTWLHGFESVTADQLFGWFHSRVNGLTVNGDINSLSVDGSVGDLRVFGEISDLRVNADFPYTPPGEWHGVNGVIWAGTRIGTINVGDGLADDGGALLPRAGIFSEGSIEKISIKGPYQVSNRQTFGLLNGTIIGKLDEIVTIGTDRFGNPITKDVLAVDKVVATDGAVITALIVGGEFDFFQTMKIGNWKTSGRIGTVSASGRNAAINGAGIYATSIEKVTAASGTLGVLNSMISGGNPNFAKYAIGEVSGGGAGIINTLIDAQGVIGSIKGLDAESDIINCRIYSTDDTNNISARDIRGSTMRIVGTLKKLSADRDLLGDGNWGARITRGSFGSLGQVSVGRDFAQNIYNVAGLVGGINVGGHFYDSVLMIQGPSTSFLKSLVVEGDIYGEIISGGGIGEIVSRSGAIYADITTLYEEWGGDVDLIETLRGYFGKLNIVGSLGEFISHDTLGENPATTIDGKTQTFSIGGDLGALTVGSKKTKTDLYANFNVGGNVGKVDISGDYFGSIQTNGNFESLIVGGKFGGDIGGGLGIRGKVIVMGELGSLNFSSEGDLAADITVGGSLGKIALKGGSILGDLTSKSGVIDGIKLAGGSIKGNITANSIGAISIKDGSIEGDLTARNGTIDSIAVKNGSISGAISITGGELSKLSISNGDLSGDVTVAGGIGKLSISNGDLLSNVMTQRGIKSLAVKGGKAGGGMISGSTISAETGISKISATAGIINATIRSATKIDSVATAYIDNTYISAGWHVGAVKVSGNVVNSHILAGYDVGADGVMGGGDDSMHGGDIKSFKVGGNLTNSMVAAGIDPVDGNFWNGTADIDGVSRVVKMSVKGSAAGSMIMADTYVDSKAPTGAVQTIKNGLAAAVGTVFGPGVGTKQLVVGGLTLSLSGTGTGTYDDATKTLVLNGTTAKTSLSIVNEGAHVDINITGSEDGELGKLQTKGDVSLNDITIHGMVNKLAANSGTLNADWKILGGVGSATVGNLSGVDILIGEVGSWKMGSMNAGSLSADSIKSFSSQNSVTGDLTVSMGDVGKIDISTGELQGDIDILAGSVKSLSVKTGSISGDVQVHAGELGSVKVGGDITGRLEVWGGAVKSIAAKGEFSGSFRNDTGVGSFSAGSFSGLLSIDGDLMKLKIAEEMTGRIRTSGNLNSASVGSMYEATMFICGNLGSLKLAGDMTKSWVSAGLDPGDGGFDEGGTGETGNLMIDADSDPLRVGQQDIAMGGNIGKVTVGGEMRNSSISAGVDPGVDGVLGTPDDLIGGVGYIESVKVTYAIYGTIPCGIFAASAMPEKVLHWKNRPFESGGEATVKSMSGPAGDLQVTGLLVGADYIQVYFSNPVDMSTIGTVWTGFATNTFEVLVSSDIDFDPLFTMDVSSDVAHSIIYNPVNYSVTMKLESYTWASLANGVFMQVTLDGTPETGAVDPGMDDNGFILPGGIAITDTRGFVLDGEANPALPSGDDIPGGDFVYVAMVGDMPDSFDEAHSSPPLPVDPAGPILSISSTFESLNDIDIFRIDATAYEYLAIEYSGLSYVDVAVFVRDEQGGANPDPDAVNNYIPSYELLARWEYTGFGSTNFQAFELPQSNFNAVPQSEEYYVVLAPWLYTGEYQLELTLAATDADLVAKLDGGLPIGEEIAYVSNFIGERNNQLGYNEPRQLVYLNFDGGTATKYTYVGDIDVGAFDPADVDPLIAGYTDEIINGGVVMGVDVVGIVENVISIFANNPVGDVNVELISTLIEWDAAVEGIYFTTVDPSTWNLDSETDFTTLFIGNGDDSVFGMALLGVASSIDVANQSKADNAITFAQNFGTYSSAIPIGNVANMLNDYSRALANTTAHELGHTLGLNHQPKTWLAEVLWADDPNNDDNFSDANTGNPMMAYVNATTKVQKLLQLGTAPLDTGEFKIGNIDTATMLFWWLS